MKRDLLRKLRRMSAREIHARSQAFLTQWCEEASYRLGVRHNPDSDLTPGADDSTFRDPWIAQHEQRAVAERLRASHPDYVEEIVKAADAICRHEFPLFGMVARYGDHVAVAGRSGLGKAVAGRFPYPRLHLRRQQRQRRRQVRVGAEPASVPARARQGVPSDRRREIRVGRPCA